MKPAALRPGHGRATRGRTKDDGADPTGTDMGRFNATNDPADIGRFKTPTLRNIALTAPYMHDGRFATLDEVIEQYSTGLQASSTIDPLMQKVDQGGVNLSNQDKAELKAFLLTIPDPSFINNHKFLPQ